MDKDIVLSTPSTDAKNCPQSPPYDKLSFTKYMKKIGRAYRKQATELISLCRTFSQARELAPDAVARLRTVLEVVDKALDSAADEKNQTKKRFEEVDQAFMKAINELASYEKDCHTEQTVIKRMASAKMNDIRVSTFLESLKAMSRFSPKEEPDNLKTVEFHLVKSLPDPNPTIVKQELSRESKIPEVLWNFRRFKEDRKRLTLKQNPHFYDFPNIPKALQGYTGGFSADPIVEFLHEATKIWVITDKPGRIFLKTPRPMRAFGNVWRVNYKVHNNDKDVIIFKDICGKLEGEDIVDESITSGQSDHVWNLERIPSEASPTSPPPVVLPSPSSPSNTANTARATPSTSTASSAPNDSFQDWRDPIRRRLNESPDTETDICISAAAVRLTGSSPPPSFPSLTPPAGSGTNNSGRGNSTTNQSSHIATQRGTPQGPQRTYSITAWSLSHGVLVGRPVKKGA